MENNKSKSLGSGNTQTSENITDFTLKSMPFPFANDGDKNNIPISNDTENGAASFNKGFPEETSKPDGVPPDRKDFNGILYDLSNNISYLQRGGIYTFDKTVSEAIGGYAKDAVLGYIDNGKLYKLISLIDNNIYDFNEDSSYIGEYWGYADNGTSIHIGTVFSYISKRPPAGAYLLNGQTISNCQEEYKQFWSWLINNIGEVETHTIYRPWTQVALTADGTIGGSNYAVKPSGTIESGYPAWRSFDMTAGGSSSVCAIKTPTADIIYYSPVKLRINTVKFVRATTSMTGNRISSYIISGSNDNVEWTELASGNWTDTDNSATWDISIDSSKYDTNKFYRYYKFYATSGSTNVTEFPEIYLYGEEFVRTYETNTGNIRAISANAYKKEIAEFGACAAFVVDTEAGSVRLPDLRNAFIQGADRSNTGQTVGAGLPNIKGTIAGNIYLRNAGRLSGAFTTEQNELTGVAGVNYSDNMKGTIYFDASKSNDTYGKSDTVQPLAAKYSWCIQVFNAATELSEQESAQLASEIQMRAQKNLANVDSNIDFVVDSWRDGESGSWYRLYRSGWCEQGGNLPTKQGVGGYAKSSTINLLKPYIDTNYTVLTKMIQGNNNIIWEEYGKNVNRTTISFDVGTKAVIWFACGQVAKNPSVWGETIHWTAKDNIKSFTVPKNGKMTATAYLYAVELSYVQFIRTYTENGETKTEELFKHGPSNEFKSGEHYEYPTFNVYKDDIISVITSGVRAEGYLTSYTQIISEQ